MIINQGKIMKNKELYQRKAQAQLDEWRADFDKFSAQASRASADRKIEINKHLKELENKIVEGKDRVAEMSQFRTDAWESASEGVRCGWESVKSRANRVTAELKR